MYLIKRYVLNKKKTEHVETRNDTEDVTYTAWFNYLESKDLVKTNISKKSADTYDHLKELTNMHFTPIRKGT